jgi:TonB family protein
VAAEAKVKELQERLAALEAEKAAAEAKAAEDAKKKMEAQAAARGQAVDPAALARAQDDARRKAQAEQERLAQEEKKRLEAQKAAEEARMAEERRKAEEEAARVAAAEATTTLPEVTTPPSPAAPTTKPGTLVTLADVGVIAPVLERRGALQYPPLALRQKVEGVVELNVLVDEKGGVSDVQVVTGAAGRSGLNEAAIDYARRQRYRPASKDGVLVKVWMPLRVKFDLPK